MSERIDIRKRIQSGGKNLYLSIMDDDLQNLVGEIMALNEEYVLEHNGELETYKTLELLRNGFSINQVSWINNLNQKLNKCASPHTLNDGNELRKTGARK